MSRSAPPIGRPSRKSPPVPATDTEPVGISRSSTVQGRGRAQVEDEVVHGSRPGPQVGVRPGGERRRGGGPVGRRHRDQQPVRGDGVRRGQVERPRVAGLAHQPVAERDRVGGVLADRPRRPADQAVARVAARRLGERQLVVAVVEPVAAVLHPVGPGQQELAPPAAGLLVLVVADDERLAVLLQDAQARAALGDHRAVATPDDLELLPARRHHAHTLGPRRENRLHGPAARPTLARWTSPCARWAPTTSRSWPRTSRPSRRSTRPASTTARRTSSRSSPTPTSRSARTSSARSPLRRAQEGPARTWSATSRSTPARPTTSSRRCTSRARSTRPAAARGSAPAWSRRCSPAPTRCTPRSTPTGPPATA